MPKLPKWLTEVGWRTVIGAALLGGILHILATLAVPFFTTTTAFATLRGSLPANRMVLLPPPAPGKQPLPFLTPDSLYAMCRFDVSVDSLAVTAAVAHPGWTLSMHTPAGDNFYVMPAQQLRRAEVSLLVVPAATTFSEFASTPRRIERHRLADPLAHQRGPRDRARPAQGPGLARGSRGAPQASQLQPRQARAVAETGALTRCALP